jgi:hypothetical protein
MEANQGKSSKSFENWRRSCEAITGLSRYPNKPGEPSRLGRFLVHSASEVVSKPETTHLGRGKDDYNELEDLLENYKEDDKEAKSRGLVEQWKNELLRTSE